MSTAVFDLWRIRALSYAERLRFSPDLVNEAVGILSAVFPGDWLEQVTEGRTRGSPFPFRVHPIGEALHVCTETQVVTLLELVEYLKFAAPSTAFPSVVDNLKAHYGSTLLQLAFAYRFDRAGATDVTLEPPVAGGRVGDIAFAVDKQGYVAECYIPGAAVVGNSRAEVQWLTQQALEAIKNDYLVFSVAVDLHETLTASGRKALVRAISSMADQLRQQADRGPYPPPLLRSLDPGTVSVGISTRVGPDERSILVLHEDFAVSRDEEPSVFVRVQWALKSEVFRAHDPVIRGEYGTHIAVWFSPEERRLNTLRQELEEPLERLGKKLKHKVAQTKLGPDWRRLLVVQTWIVDELERASEEDLRRFRRRIH